MKKTVLKGITWGHSRGITPLLAASQRYSELNPLVDIVWNKRTLQEFADYPIERLTESYDLLIIDHPWVGCANATRCVLPLNDHISEAFLSDQAANSVGASHRSYTYGDAQWALAIDAATPVASYRADLFEKNGERPPDTWPELLSLARKGKVILPGIPIDTLMCFYAFCIANGGEPFLDGYHQRVIDDDTGKAALEQMRSLWSLCDPGIYDCNPIAVAERMTRSDDFWYCPFAYGYSNYARSGYASHVLTYTGTVRMEDQQRLRTTLGGTGLSVSAFSKHPLEAVDFAQWVVSPVIQSTLYAEHGGQPAYRSAWLNESNNLLTHDYFKNTLETLDEAYVRPRYNGYLHFQDLAGDPIRDFLRNGGRPGDVMRRVNDLYVESQALGT
jgi:multiple sugar transport system substrate-binding protein